MFQMSFFSQFCSSSLFSAVNTVDVNSAQLNTGCLFGTLFYKPLWCGMNLIAQAET